MLNEKTKSKFNLFALLTAILMFLAACVSLLVGTTGSADLNEQNKAFNLSPTVNLYSGEVKVVKSLANPGEVAYVSKNIRATITPNTVADQYVTWTIAWASDAPLKGSDITEYLQVTQETEGSLSATVNCYKAFRGSKAILTCTTRQGNKKATCEIVYEGVPSSMTLSPASSMTQYNLGAESVDMLYVGNTYQLNIALDNIFHDAGTNFNDYVVTVSGEGTVKCGTYSTSPRGDYWNNQFEDIELSTIVCNLITASTTDNKVSISVDKSFYEYYESSETKHVEMVGETTYYHNKVKSLNVDENGNLPCLVLTVKHRTLNFSAQYRFFIGEQVSSVSTSSSTITF